MGYHRSLHLMNSLLCYYQHNYSETFVEQCSTASIGKKAVSYTHKEVPVCSYKPFIPEFQVVTGKGCNVSVFRLPHMAHSRTSPQHGESNHASSHPSLPASVDESEAAYFLKQIPFSKLLQELSDPSINIPLPDDQLPYSLHFVNFPAPLYLLMSVHEAFQNILWLH